MYYIQYTTECTNNRRMKKKRGMSFQQKKTAMLRIFYQSRSVLNYQELEKASVKVGIPFPNVKEILICLRSDSLVESDKIGAGVFYWAFPSHAHSTLKSKTATAQANIAATTQKLLELRLSLEKHGQSRALDEHRRTVEEEIGVLAHSHQLLLQEVRKYTRYYLRDIRYDPERYELLRKQNGECVRRINEMTDNVEQIKKFIKSSNYSVTEEEMENVYGIPPMEYYD